jgi:myosin V
MSSPIDLWVPHPDLEWILARLVRDDTAKGEYIVEQLGGGRMAVRKDATCLLDQSHLADLANLCLMNNLHEAPLLDVLRRRFERDAIYTYTGDVLISINPYHPIEGLYDDPMRYLDLPIDDDKGEEQQGDGQKAEDVISPDGKGIEAVGASDLVRIQLEQNRSASHSQDSLPPHVFFVANSALQRLERKCKSDEAPKHQSIIVSGESGAGEHPRFP